MRIFRLYLIVIVCLLNTYQVIGQVDLFPVHFGQVGLVKSILNPALQNIESANSFTFSNQFFTGAFNKFDNFYFQASIGLNKKDSLSNHSYLGLKITNEIEGDYIEKPRYFVLYAWHARLSEKFKIGTGIHFGRSAYIFRGTNVSSLGSDSNWDGDFGVALYSEYFVAGIALNQFLNAKIIPKEMYFRWKRFSTFYLQKTFQLSEMSLFSVHFQNQFLPTYFDKTDLGILLTYNQLLVSGANWYLNNNMTFLVGLKDISMGIHHFNVIASYNVPFNITSRANIQSYELSIKYTLN